MKARIISSIIGLPILIGIIMSKDVAIIGGAILVLMIIGLVEFYRAFEGFDMRFGGIGIVFSSIYLISITLKETSRIGNYIFFFALFLLFYGIIFYKKGNLKNIVVTLISFFYVSYMLSFIVQLSNLKSYGSVLVGLVFVVAWSADTFACLVGQRIGKHKLTPVVSPNKSVEGFVAGIIGSSLLACLYGVIVLKFTNVIINNFLVICILAGATGSIVAQFGDLTASLIKRTNGIKDFGKIIPGHGGVLDRFDSVILTAPFIYYVFTMIVS